MDGNSSAHVIYYLIQMRSWCFSELTPGHLLPVHGSTKRIGSLDRSGRCSCRKWMSVLHSWITQTLVKASLESKYQLAVFCVTSIYAGHVIVTLLVVRRAEMWPSSRSFEKPANMRQSRSFQRTKSYGVFDSLVKESQCEYDSRRWRHNIHVVPQADNRTFSAATERSVVTTRYLKITLDWK